MGVYRVVAHQFAFRSGMLTDPRPKASQGNPDANRVKRPLRRSETTCTRPRREAAPTQVSVPNRCPAGSSGPTGLSVTNTTSVTLLRGTRASSSSRVQKSATSPFKARAVWGRRRADMTAKTPGGLESPPRPTARLANDHLRKTLVRVRFVLEPFQVIGNPKIHRPESVITRLTLYRKRKPD